MRISYPFKMIALLFSIFLCTSFSAYSNQTNEPKLLNYNYIGVIDKPLAKSLLQKISVFSQIEASYDAALYKLTYETTDPFGKKAIASGLVAIPDSDNHQGIVVYLHGTRVKYDDVPSNCTTPRYQIYPALFTNAGDYVLVMPDYLGYGDSSLRPHPYVDAKSLAQTSIDMLKVSHDFLKEMNVKQNDKLYISGYSEGGFSTMAMFEYLQKNNPEITITAVAPGSGPYDMDATLSSIFIHPDKNSSLYAALFFHSLQSYNHYWPDYASIFQSPYDKLIPELFDGFHDADEIREQLGKLPQDILNKDLFKSLIDGSEEHLSLLRSLFNRYEFTPKAPLLLVGTKGDTDVPFSNTLIAYEKLKAKYDQVYYKSVSDVLDHRQANPLVTLEQYLFFKSH